MNEAGVWATILRLIPAASAFFVPLAIYLASLQIAPGDWDTAELQVVTYILGIAHPTGFPLYTLAGFLASHIPLGTIPARTGGLNALCTATTSLLVFTIARRLGIAPWSAALGACASALGTTIWLTAVRADVHAMVVMWEFAALAAALAWRQSGERRFFLLAALAVGLALATHPVVVWTAPGILAVLGIRTHRIDLRLALAALALGFAPLLFYAYLPLRSAYVVEHHLDPTVELGFIGNAFWNYDDPSTPSGFITLVTGSAFDKHTAAIGVIDVRTWPDKFRRLAEHMTLDYQWLVPLAALAGFAVFAWRRRLALGALLLFTLPAALFGLGYEVEAFRDRYFIPFYWTLGIFAGAGISSVTAGALRGLTLARVLSLLLIVGTAQLAFEHRDWFVRNVREDHREVREAIWNTTQANAILIAPWLRITELAYERYVTGELQQRLLVSGGPDAFLDRIPEWARKHPIYALDLPSGYASPKLRVVELNSEPHIVQILPK